MGGITGSAQLLAYYDREKPAQSIGRRIQRWENLCAMHELGL